MLIDSHCHLDRIDLTPYAQNFAQMMEQTRIAGVEHILCVAINLQNYPAMRTKIASSPDVSVSVGLHPNESPEHTITVDDLLKLATEDSKVVAIGETGLDNYRMPKNTDRQQERFRIHIQAAKTCSKPLIIHTRQAAQDTLRILKEEQAADVGGVFHCFTENWDIAKAVLDLGFLLSFSGIITFPKAHDLRAVVKKVPLDRLLIETDSPYLTPVPYRGKSNEPKFVAIVAEQVAKIQDISVTRLIDSTAENFFQVFRPILS
ncbi:deoxyribonuclease [Achromatium sp. WMS3]|nr:deoxyribonuclease [Achromatium sp. WMS3]